MLASVERDGFVLSPRLLSAGEASIAARALERMHVRGAGTRNLLHEPWCRALVARIKRRLLASGVMGSDYVAVQCILFDKTATRNWLVALHQDLSIPVKARVEHPALRGWSTKENQHYVQPPVELLERLLAVRLHIDPSAAQSGPLRLVAGSHRHGRVTGAAARRLREAAGEVECLAERGDALLMRPLVLHASSKAARPSRRRVLHVVFGPAALPCGLEWGTTV